MILSFTLSMPNKGSWNGKWSGEKSYYAKVINFGRSKKAIKHATEILNQRSFHYNFGDGWSASIKVAEVTAREAADIRHKSRGFYGYDWMIESIRYNGCIES